MQKVVLVTFISVNVSPLFPSNNKLMYIFLEYFQKRELYYETDMKKCVSVTKGIS